MTDHAAYYFEHLEYILLFCIAAFVSNSYAVSRKFYTLPRSLLETPSLLKLWQVAACFAIYLTCSIGIAPLLLWAEETSYLWIYPGRFPPVVLASLAQFVSLLLIFFLLFFFCRTIDRATMRKIWKDHSLPQTSSLFHDVWIGACSWLASFPLVVIIGQLADMLVFALFGVETYEQVAVRYLKMTLATPSLLAIALFSILVAAPILEEFLFRGMLQNWLKKHLGKKAAILVTALLFSAFHLSPSQGVGNISLILSLFFFGCFLGFVYERQGSLLASMSLHITFNTISTLRIIFST